MLFSSITFLYFFLPITLLIYYITPKKLKNYVLLLASMVFYFFGEPVYTVLLIISSVSDYLHSLYIENHRGQKAAKVALISSIIINLLLLGFFKYIDFFIININLIFKASIPLLNVPLPIGISFFTFQTMSYTIDVYRGKANAQKNLATFATFVCLFPQLVAGPIVRYTDIARELDCRKPTSDNISKGILRFVIGLGKKVILANTLGELCVFFRESADPSVLFYWIYIIAFCLQTYFDFSGYSDMAIGLGAMFGFKFPENFNYPFISKSISEYWRRWHITLGSWFKDYVYIPMGGNRVSKLKYIRNVFVVWALTGLWHGAEWNFVLWGLYFGVILLLEKFFLGKILEKIPKFISHIYVILLVTIGYAIFNSTSLPMILNDLKGMFALLDIPLTSAKAIYYLRSYSVIFIVAIIGATPAMKLLVNRLSKIKVLSVVISVAEPIFVAAILLVSTGFLIDGSFNPFLYFRF